MSGDHDIVDIPTDLLRAGRYQVRKGFVSEHDTILASDLSGSGDIINPISVVSSGDGYEVLAGERRWRAAVTAGKNTVPCRIFDYKPDSLAAASLGLKENLHRKSLNAVEEAELFLIFHQTFGLTHDAIAEKFLPGKSGRAHVSNRLRLLDLPDEVQSILRKETLTGKHGEKLLKVKEPARCVAFAKEAVSRRWTVKALDNAIKYYLSPTDRINMPEGFEVIEKRYSDSLGANVKITAGKAGYSVKIQNQTIEGLQRVLAMIDKAHQRGS
jgi:ParB family chromosome partitioning protein